MSELDVQFIEVAAREWLRLRGNGEHLSGYRDDCNECHGSDVIQRSVHYELTDLPCPYVASSELALVTAASLHGRLLERNSCKSIDEIVAAAQEAERLKIELALRQAVGNDAVAEHVVVEFELDTAAFSRAVAIEAMGGAKVFDSFAEFRVGAARPHLAECTMWWIPDERDCNCGGPRPFRVPLIAQEAR